MFLNGDPAQLSAEECETKTSEGRCPPSPQLKKAVKNLFEDATYTENSQKRLVFPKAHQKGGGVEVVYSVLGSVATVKSEFSNWRNHTDKPKDRRLQDKFTDKLIRFFSGRRLAGVVQDGFEEHYEWLRIRWKDQYGDPPKGALKDVIDGLIAYQQDLIIWHNRRGATDLALEIEAAAQELRSSLDSRESVKSFEITDSHQDPSRTLEHSENKRARPSLSAGKDQADETATHVRRYAIHATPLGIELFRRMPWPENLLMQIGVDRSSLIAVVSGIDGDDLFEALSSVERSVTETDTLSCFGRRSWSLSGRSTADVPKEKEARGLVWKVPESLTTNHLTGVIRACWPGVPSTERDGLASAGNVLVAVVEDDREATVEPLLGSLRDLVRDMGMNVDVCGWSVEQAYDLIKAAAGQTDTKSPKAPEVLSDFEWKILQVCHSTQDVFRRSDAIHALSEEYPEMSLKWRRLCDWIRDPTSYEDFLTKVDLDVCQIALLSGLLTGHDATPNAELAVAVVRAIRHNPDLSSILLSLPVCAPVLKELSVSEPKCRATVGLVSAEEMGRAIKPWVGNPVDQWRHGRVLGF